VFVRGYGFTVTEHDLDKPWLVLGSEHHTVSLPDDRDFSLGQSADLVLRGNDGMAARAVHVELDPWALVLKGPTP